MGGIAVLVAAIALFASIIPSRFWTAGVGQGNMFKYVRMAAALSSSGSLDISRAEGASERATFTRFLSFLPRIAERSASEGAELIGNLLAHAVEGRLYVGRVEATRANRSMFRSHEGGLYYINAPGPGILLVPAYLLDCTLNRWLGREGQVALIFFWILLGALLVLEMVRTAHYASENWGAG
jgi:hypothetical protein